MRYFSLTLLALAAAACSGPKKEPVMIDAKPPVAAKKPHSETIHNIERKDDYFWLRERENKEVINYLTAENTYTDTVLSPVKEFRDKLFTEMKARIKEDDNGVAQLHEDGYMYNYRFVKGGEYAVHFRQKGDVKAKEEVIFDENEMGKDKAYYDMGDYTVSDDGKLAV